MSANHHHPLLHPLQPWEGALRASLEGERCMDDLIEILARAGEEICDPEGDPAASITHHHVINGCVERAIKRCYDAEVDGVKDLRALAALLNAAEAVLKNATALGLDPDALGVIIDTTDLPTFNPAYEPFEDWAVSWDRYEYIEYSHDPSEQDWVIRDLSDLPSERDRD